MTVLKNCCIPLECIRGYKLGFSFKMYFFKCTRKTYIGAWFTHSYIIILLEPNEM